MISVHDPETLGKPRGPFQVVEEAPQEVPVDRYPLADSLFDRVKMCIKVLLAPQVSYLAVRPGNVADNAGG